MAQLVAAEAKCWEEKVAVRGGAVRTDADIQRDLDVPGTALTGEPQPYEWRIAIQLQSVYSD